MIDVLSISCEDWTTPDPDPNLDQIKLSKGAANVDGLTTKDKEVVEFKVQYKLDNRHCCNNFLPKRSLKQ